MDGARAERHEAFGNARSARRAGLALPGVLALAALLVSPASALASAGGFAGGGFGGGFGGGGGGLLRSAEEGTAPPWWLFAIFLAIITLPFLVPWLVFVWRGTIARATLSRMPESAPEFDPDSIASQARHAFLAIQKAWAAEDIGPAHEAITPRLTERLGAKLAEFRDLGRVNRMEQLKLKDAVVVGVSLGGPGDEDRVWVWLEATLIDYILEGHSHLLLEGNPNRPRQLREVWSFVWTEGRWLADEIDQRPHFWSVALLPLRIDTFRAEHPAPEGARSRP